jgi:hypothetical protein
MFFVVSYFLKKDPELLERRMRMREKEEKQKTIIKFAYIFFFIGFIIFGLDYRQDIYSFSSFSGKIVMLPGSLKLRKIRKLLQHALMR